MLGGWGKLKGLIWATIRADIMEGEKILHVHYLGGVRLGLHIYMNDWDLVGGISEWCMVY